jgi:hypothetical protein
VIASTRTTASLQLHRELIEKPKTAPAGDWMKGNKSASFGFLPALFLQCFLTAFISTVDLNGLS